MTAKRYLDDPYCRDARAEMTASVDGWCTLSQTVFYPGGAGQPCDRGQWLVGGEVLTVSSVREDESGRIWHCVGRPRRRSRVNARLWTTKAVCAHATS